MVEEVLPVGEGAGLGVGAVEDVLVHRLLVPEELAGLAVELPQDAVLAGAEDGPAPADVDEHPLVDLVEVEGLAGHVLEVPGEVPVAGPEGDGRVGVEGGVVHRHAAAPRHPRLGLGDPEVDEVEGGVVAAGDPGVAAAAQEVGHVGPGVPAGLVGPRDGIEAPQPLAGGRVVTADEAALQRVAVAAAQPLHEGAVDHHRTARVAEPFSVVGDDGVPHPLAGAGVEGDQPGVGGGHEQLVFVDGEVPAHARVAGRRHLHLVLPDKVAGGGVEGLHHRADAREEHHPVVDDRRRRVPAALVHRPDPRQLQLPDV